MAPDNVTAKAEPKKAYANCPTGVHQAVLADVIDLGDQVKTWPGSPDKIVAATALVFQVSKINPDTSRRFEIAIEFTLSMGEKANLPKFLGNWRGSAISDRERFDGINLASWIGYNGLLTVAHKTSHKGRTYAVGTNISPLLEGLPEIQVAEYQRGKFWVERIAEYAKAVSAWREKEQGRGGPPQSLGDFPRALEPDEDDGSLPF